MKAVTVTPQERVRLRELEEVIQRGQGEFWKVADALYQIWSEELFRDEYKTWDQYVAKRWPDFSRRHSYRLIDLGHIRANVTPGSRKLLTHEKHARAIKGLRPKTADSVIQETAASGPVTTTRIREIVRKKFPTLPADEKAEYLNTQNTMGKNATPPGKTETDRRAKALAWFARTNHAARNKARRFGWKKLEDLYRSVEIEIAALRSSNNEKAA